MPAQTGSLRVVRAGTNVERSTWTRYARCVISVRATALPFTTSKTAGSAERTPAALWMASNTRISLLRLLRKESWLPVGVRSAGRLGQAQRGGAGRLLGLPDRHRRAV